MKIAAKVWLTLGLLLTVATCAGGQEGDRDAGLAAFEQGQFAQAEALFRAGVVAREKRGADESGLAEALNRLAWFFCMRARYSDAEPVFRRALAIRESKLGPNHPEVGRALHNLATLVAQMDGKATEAEALFRRALEIREKMPGEKDLDLARTLHGLSRVCWAERRPGEGETFARRAQAIREKAAAIEPEEPADKPKTAGAAQSQFTIVFHYKPMPSEAALLMDRVLEVRGWASKDERIQESDIFTEMADYLFSRGYVRRAVTLYERALAIREEAHAPEDVLMAENLDSVADLHSLRKDYAEAEALQRRSLAIWAKLLGPKDVKVAQRLDVLAQSLMAQERDREAEVVLQRAVAIMDGPSGAGNTDTDEDREKYTRRLRKARRNAQLVERVRPTEADLNYLKGLANRLNGLKYQLWNDNLETLDTLYVCRCGIDDDGMAHLRGLINLEELRLNDTKVGDAGLAHIEALMNLRKLDLGNTRVTDAGLVHLLRFSDLEDLDLSRTRVTDAGLIHLPGHTRLKKLNLSCTGVTDAGLAHLRDLTQLQELVLIGTRVGGAGLARFDRMTGLEEINLAGSPVDDDGMAHLRGLTNLRVLTLDGPQISDAGLSHLKELGKLTKLHLSGTQVTDAGLVHLKDLTHLQELSLLGTQVRGPGLSHLVGLPQLSTLNIGGQIDGTALVALRRFNNLKDLDIRDELGLDPKEVEDLRRALPGVTINIDEDNLTLRLRKLTKKLP